MIKDVIKQIEESEYNFDKYSNMAHMECENVRKLKEKLNISKFEYKGFKCNAMYKQISHLSEIATIPGDHKIYIYINSNLSKDKTDKELSYSVNKMLPGVVKKLIQEEEINQKEKESEEQSVKNLVYDGLDYSFIENIFRKSCSIDFDFTNLISMIDVIMGEFATSSLAKMGIIYQLGVIAGKRKGRARRHING